MNLWIVMLIPLLSLNFVVRFLQYLANKDLQDKIIPLIVLTSIQLIGIILIVMVLNKHPFDIFIFWMIISTIFFSVAHKAIDGRETELRLSKEISLFIIFSISSIFTMILFYNIIL